MPQGVTPLAGHYFLYGQAVWVLPSGRLFDLAAKPSLQGAEILELVSTNETTCIRCDLKQAQQEKVYLSTQKISDYQFQVALVDELSDSGLRAITIPGCEKKAIIDHTIYSLFPDSLKHEIFGDGASIVLAGSKIPNFADKYQNILLQYGNSNTHSLFARPSLFVSPEEIQFILDGKPIMRKGVGKAMAVPTLMANGQRASASQVSEQMKDGYAPFCGRWISEKTLKAFGIGPMERLINGAPLSTIELRPNEVLSQGGSRIEGPWSRLHLPLDAWKQVGPNEEIYFGHLEFLRQLGISGGVSGRSGLYEPQWLPRYIRHLKGNLDGGKALVLMKRMFYDNCVDATSLTDIPVFRGQKGDPALPNRLEGVYITFYNNLPKFPALHHAKWDILLLVEPDDNFKSNRSAVFTNTKRISARLRLGQFATDLESWSSPQRTALTELFRISSSAQYAVGQDPLSYYIRDIRHPKALPRAHRFSVRATQALTQTFANRPAMVELAGRSAQGIPIPQRETSFDVVGDARFTLRIGVSSPHGGFVQQARQYVNKTVTHAHFVPFMFYWPTYGSMSQPQLNWYFYWRGQVRKGQYPETDLSYIFIYVYELINGVGYTNPGDGYRQLWAVWQAYRVHFAKLDSYLPSWIFDFLILNKLHNELSGFLGRASNLGSDALYNLMIDAYYVRQATPITMDVIKRVASYRLEKSKFYQQTAGAEIEQGMAEIINQIDSKMRAEHGNGLFTLFHPYTLVSEPRYCYVSAVYEGNASYTIEYPPFTTHQPLTQFLDSVLKYTENRMREKAGFTGRLRNIDLDDTWRSLIDSAFGIVVPADEIVQKPVHIELDTAALNRLRKESDELHDMLSSEAVEDTETFETIATKTAVPVPMDISTEPRQLLTELQEIRALVSACSELQQDILRALYEAGWEMTSAQLNQRFPSSMIEAEIDEINSMGMDQLGTIIIANENGNWIVEDDFRDEFEHIYSVQGFEFARHEEPDDIAPVQVFFSQLEDFELEVLRLLSGHEHIEIISELATMHGSMPELVYDSINEQSQEHIGDFVIDTTESPPSIMEEYTEEIRLYFAKVVNE